MITNEEIDALLRARTAVIGSDGQKLGTLGRIYLDDQTDEPNFGTVNTGLFGLREHFFPLTDAHTSEEGLNVPFTKDMVKDAPSIDPEGHLSAEQEHTLYAYYRQTGPQAASRGEESGNGSENSYPDVVAIPSPSMREEHLSTEYPDTGRGRLRKYLVSDGETEKIPLVRSEEPGGSGRHVAGVDDASGQDPEGRADPGAPEDQVVATPEGPVSRTTKGRENTKR